MGKIKMLKADTSIPFMQNLPTLKTQKTANKLYYLSNL